MCGEACAFLRRALASKYGGYTVAECERLVRVFHGNTLKKTKKWVMEAFKKAASDGGTSVIVATEALGMGVDLDNVEEVVVYKLPKNKTLSALWQRAGRAARQRGQRGRFTFLADNWLYRSPGESDDAGQVSASTQRLPLDGSMRLSQVVVDDGLPGGQAAVSSQRKRQATGNGGGEKQKKRAALDKHLVQFVNGPQCRRQTLLEHFENQKEPGDETIPPRCCDVCLKESIALEAPRWLAGDRFQAETGDGGMPAKRKGYAKWLQMAKDVEAECCKEFLVLAILGLFLPDTQLEAIAKFIIETDVTPTEKQLHALVGVEYAMGLRPSAAFIRKLKERRGRELRENLERTTVETVAMGAHHRVYSPSNGRPSMSPLTPYKRRASSPLGSTPSRSQQARTRSPTKEMWQLGGSQGAMADGSPLRAALQQMSRNVRR